MTVKPSLNGFQKGIEPRSFMHPIEGVRRCTSAPTVKPNNARYTENSAQHLGSPLASIQLNSSTVSSHGMEGRSRASAVACNGSLYFFGGYGTMNTYTGNSFRNDTFQYSLESQQWLRLECLGYFPKPRIHHSAVVKDHKMVIYGGINEDNMFLNDMFALSLRENPPTWKKVAMQVSTNHMSSSQINNPSAPFLCCHSAAVHPTRNSMVVFGGKIGGGLISPHLFEFSFATQEWSRLGSAAQPLSPSARLQAIDPVAPTEGPLLYNHSEAIINNTMYIYGGYTYHQGNNQTLNTMVFAFNFR
jgi:N-acetylneuraminic acid mutarotase